MSESLYVQVLVALVFVLLGTLVFLQRSRNKYKGMQANLLEVRTQLQQLVIQRTERLNELNADLNMEIANQRDLTRHLRQARDFLDSILNSMPSIIIGITPQGVITHWNERAEKETGVVLRRAIGRSVFEVYPELPVASITMQEAISSGIPRITENVKRGSVYYDVTVYPLLSADEQGVVIQLDDVTLRVNVETMMIQNEKMASLGTLAAGTAHEVNNPLAAMLQGLQNVERRLSVDLQANQQAAQQVGLDLAVLRSYIEMRELPRIIDSIREAGERARGIVSNMLQFSRVSRGDMANIDVSVLLQSAVGLLRQNRQESDEAMPEKVHIEIACDEQLPMLKCHASEMQQVIFNMLANAEQAVCAVRAEGGLIDVQARDRNGQLEIEITDNGPGIDADNLPHVLEPFFTTKAVGHGTGLGLSVAYYIVTKHHGGDIQVTSPAGAGACFKIILPWQR